MTMSTLTEPAAAISQADLARMQSDIIATIKTQFDSFKKKFDSIEKKIELFDQKVELLDKKIESLDNELGIFQTIIVADTTKNALMLEKLSLPAQGHKTDAIDNDDESFKPVDNTEDFYTLCENIRSTEGYTETVKAQLWKTANRSSLGKKSGDAFYHFVDLIFTRKFMQVASWTGGSSKNPDGKLAFKNYESIKVLFLELIRKYDEKITDLDYVKYMSQVLHISTQRVNAKFMRTFAPTARRTKLS